MYEARIKPPHNKFKTRITKMEGDDDDGNDGGNGDDNNNTEESVEISIVRILFDDEACVIIKKEDFDLA